MNDPAEGRNPDGGGKHGKTPQRSSSKRREPLGGGVLTKDPTNTDWGGRGRVSGKGKGQSLLSKGKTQTPVRGSGEEKRKIPRRKGDATPYNPLYT